MHGNILRGFIQIIIISLMGNNGQSPCLCFNTNDEQYQQIIGFAINRSQSPFKSFLIENSSKLHDIISTNVQLTVKINNYKVIFKPKGRSSRQKEISNQSDSTKAQVYHDYPYELIILEQTQKLYTRQQGLIISPHAYFSGEFKDGAIHGDGIYLFLDGQNYSIKNTVKGRWEDNTPLELIIYGPEAVIPVLSIAFIDGEQQAKLTLSDRTTYLGSINFSGAKRVEDIMTGKGVINFPNKDIYIGQVKGGLMHTSSNMGRFISRADKVNYTGGYANGFRQGEGTLSIDVNGKLTGIRSFWKRGMMDGQFTVEEPKNFQEIQLPYSTVIKNKRKDQKKRSTNKK